MAENLPTEPAVAPRAERSDVDGPRAGRAGWRAGVLPAWVLVVGLVVFAVAGLGLATLGAAGILAATVLELLVVALLYSWCSAY